MLAKECVHQQMTKGGGGSYVRKVTCDHLYTFNKPTEDLLLFIVYQIPRQN